MGSNFCAQVNCCKSIIYQEGNGIMPQNYQIVENTSQTGRQDRAEQNPQQHNSQQAVPLQTVDSPETTQDQIESLSELLHDLAKIKNKFLDVETPQEIYLSIDEVWKNEMRLIERPLSHYYTKISENEYSRKNQHNSKFQILFRQHFPKFGIFFFQISLIQYEPERSGEFVFGVVDYLQAVKKAHCKGAQFEESYTYRIKDIDSKQKITQKINILFRVEINRESNKIFFYVNKQEVKSKDLKPEIVDQAASLAPYIQTQGIDVTFTWKESPASRSATYKMSTIIEEESSINVTH